MGNWGASQEGEWDKTRYASGERAKEASVDSAFFGVACKDCSKGINERANEQVRSYPRRQEGERGASQEGNLASGKLTKLARGI